MAPGMKITSKSSRKTDVALPPRCQFPNGAVLEEVVHDQLDPNRSRIRKFTVLPGSPTMHVISQLPCRRRVLWRRSRCTQGYSVRRISTAYQRDAALIQTRGQMVYSGEDMCAGCKGALGPFTTCVVAMTNKGEYPRFGACANCVWRGIARECSCCPSLNTDIDGERVLICQFRKGSEQDPEYESDDEDGDEEESFLLSPPPSQNSRGTTSRKNNTPSKASSQPMSTTSGIPINRSKRAHRGPSIPPRARRPPSPAVVIPSPSKRTGLRTGTTVTRWKYFKVPPGLSPNTAEDIRLAIEELNAVRAKLASRLELLESVQLGSWE
ncbi:hypothetical protein AJ78_06526 [Emergomyces pasteurianus Ep9510]|uniref:Uncharacterized protein n=1 Tax=Emergomyces pasteurianus Ep9510 TaxID=1447872 RepID=A0A1J9PA66_9EURO|nr:hypothetical protein AJ78_06526 [Emergomyces pasteurianus Ep9510]